MNEPWTIKKLLDWCGNYFATKEIPSPRLDAELLLAHVLKLKRLDLYLQFDRPLTETELASYKALVQRRAKHEPVAYLTGTKYFYSREFEVDKNVLIPRPDTETLVEEILKKLPPAAEGKILRGLDVGTGSGIIAITLAAERPDIHMFACDISEAALAVARNNASKNNVTDRIEFVHADFLNSSSPIFDSRFSNLDFIVSNPPYITEKEHTELMPSVRDFEPHTALVGGNDGLDFYRVLANQAQKFLGTQKLIAVEIGETQKKAVEKLFGDAGFKNIATTKDLSGWDRVVVAEI